MLEIKHSFSSKIATYFSFLKENQYFTMRCLFSPGESKEIKNYTSYTDL